MTRSAALLALALIAAPASAGSYSAKPAAAPTQARIIARDIAWTCNAEACRGSTEESRPQILCQGLAKRAGRLHSFVVNGRAFSDAELAQCNTAAKDGGGQTLATAN
jgi:hypothetical protein